MILFTAEWFLVCSRFRLWPPAPPPLTRVSCSVSVTALARDPRRTPRVGAGGGHIHTLHYNKMPRNFTTFELIALDSFARLCAGF